MNSGMGEEKRNERLMKGQWDVLCLYVASN
jgi:hypothetical protein